MIKQLFGSTFPSGTPRFSIGAVGADALPTSSPNQRFPAIVALLSQANSSVEVDHTADSMELERPKRELAYDWLQGRVWEELVLAALHTVLERLPLLERPWGVGLRSTSALRPVGTGLPNPLGESLYPRTVVNVAMIALTVERRCLAVAWARPMASVSNTPSRTVTIADCSCRVVQLWSYPGRFVGELRRLRERRQQRWRATVCATHPRPTRFMGAARHQASTTNVPANRGLPRATQEWSSA